MAHDGTRNQCDAAKVHHNHDATLNSSGLRASSGAILTVAAFASLYDVSIMTVRRWLLQGLPSIQVTGRGAHRIDQVAAKAWLDQRSEAVRVQQQIFRVDRALLEKKKAKVSASNCTHQASAPQPQKKQQRRSKRKQKEVTQ